MGTGDARRRHVRIAEAAEREHRHGQRRGEPGEALPPQSAAPGMSGGGAYRAEQRIVEAEFGGTQEFVAAVAGSPHPG